METPGKKIDLVFVTNLYKEFTEALSKSKEETILKRLNEAIQISKSYIQQLREYVIQRHFENAADEIFFFKQHKPKFFTHLFYYSELYCLEINKPIGTPQSLKEYLQVELDKIKMDFERNKSFYSYLRSGLTHLDEMYFLRGKQMIMHHSRFLEEVDPDNSTGFDFLVAIFWSNEKLASYLNKKLSDSTKPLISFDSPTEAPKVVWTDSKTALIELVYAFKAKGSFNNGKATLKDITDFVQQHFGVELTNPTRDFQEILRRKTGYTIYLDGLKESYLQYIDKIETRDRR